MIDFLVRSLADGPKLIHFGQDSQPNRPGGSLYDVAATAGRSCFHATRTTALQLAANDYIAFCISTVNLKNRTLRCPDRMS
jgi:hypothetical protein